MILAVAFLAAICVFIWAAPEEVTKMLLSAAWLFMAVAAIALPILAALRII